ncbi:MAG: ATP-binding cassette domain-containing protein [Sedimentibacter sp.]
MIDDRIITKKNQLMIQGYFFMILIIGLLQIIYPIYISKFINEIYKGSVMLQNILIIIGAFIISKVVFNIICTLYSSKIYWNVTSHIKKELIFKTIDMDYENITKQNIGRLTQIIENDTEQLVRFYVLFVAVLLKDIFFVLGVIVIAIRANIAIGALILLTSILLFYVFNFINKKSEVAWEQTKNAYQDFFAIFSEVLMIIEEFSWINQENYLLSYLQKAIRKLFQADFVSSYVSYKLWIASILSFGFIKSAVLLIGSLPFIYGEMDAGTIYLFIYYIDMLTDPIEELRIQLEDIPAVKESTKRICSILEIQDHLKYGNKVLSNRVHSIEMVNVNFSYDEHSVFNNFSFKFITSNIYGLVGKSGSGKSTLINLITRLYDVDSGEILVNEISIKDFAQGEINSEIEYIGQNEVLYNKDYTVKEFIDPKNIYPNHIINEFMEEYICSSMKLDDSISCVNLSSGEEKTLILLKALLSQKSVILLDEIFSGIDYVKIEKALNTLKETSKITIVITHEKEVMELCDDIIALEEDKK